MKRLKLHHWILIAMLLGAAIGLPLSWLGSRGDVSPETVATVADVGKKLGSLFLRLLQMLVVPLIFTSLVSGVTGMGDLRKLGRLGWRTLAFYLSTSFVAIVTGIVLVNLIAPGEGADLALLEAGTAGHELPAVVAEERGIGAVLWAQLEGMIPKNPLQAAANGDILPLIFFALVLGVFLSLVEHGPAGEHDSEDEHRTRRENVALVRRFFEGFFAVMMRLTLAVVSLAPIGVFGFMLGAAAGHGLAAFEALGLYALTVFVGLLVHALVTLPILARTLGGRSPLSHAKAMAPALLTAFSTASSNGTLPLTMKCVEESGVPNEVGSFVLPLGATINMDGTALYEAVAVLFIAQVYGMDLSLGQQAVVALTALLASVGAAGIPHAGTVMMVVVLSAVGLPTTAVGLILAVDRVLDMCRTTVNVWSDSVAALVVARFAGRS
ncbi:MAG: dicarboxylate/amino acid:cation symporter [Sandaracinus sp.]|nr:dicarboxylate/amino acid:cation symporter [Sandaracinus sp.]MCB9635771.1 dicarboxylate/amino acid:cation symporter [Sandaracinus sp.]